MKILLCCVLVLLCAGPAVATVNDTLARDDYTANGSTVDFPTTFTIMDGAGVTVYLDAVLQVFNTQYTVTFTGTTKPSVGTVHFLSPPLAGVHVTILRGQLTQQTSVYQPNEAFPAKRIETDYDKNTMVDQKQDEELRRALLFYPYSLQHDVFVQDPVDGKCLQWQSTGSGGFVVASSECQGSSGGTGSPAPPNKSVQFNNGGLFAGDPLLLWDNTLHRLQVGTLPLGTLAPGPLVVAKVAPSGTGAQAGLFQTTSGTNVGAGLVTLGQDNVAVSGWAFRGADSNNPLYGGNFGVHFLGPGQVRGVEIDVQNFWQDTGVGDFGHNVGLWLNRSGPFNSSSAVEISSQDPQGWWYGIHFDPGNAGTGSSPLIKGWGIYAFRAMPDQYIGFVPSDDLNPDRDIVTLYAFDETTKKAKLNKRGQWFSRGDDTGVTQPAFTFIDDPTTGVYQPAPSQIALGVAGAEVFKATSLGTLTTGAIGSAGRTFAALGAPPAPALVWCSDCQETNPCTGGGSAGAWAFRVASNTAWSCTFGVSGGGAVASVTGTTNQITASPTTGAVVLTLPSAVIAPGSLAVTNLGGTGVRCVHVDNAGVMSVASGDCATGGSGSVTNFTAGNLSPVFTTSVATPTTTPALTFSLSTQTANTFFAGPSSAGPSAPTFRALVAADLPAGAVAPPGAQYWTGAADATLTAEKNLGALTTGLVINTAGTPSAYAGTSCTNQFVRSLNASGVATCATVANTDLASASTTVNGVVCTLGGVCTVPAVTSVAMTVPSILAVAGSPITTSGTLAVSLTTQTANTVFAGPSTAGPSVPTFRALVAADLPTSVLPAAPVGSTQFNNTGVLGGAGPLVVHAFGVTPANSAATNSANIGAAMTAACGGTLFFPPGVYNFNTTISSSCANGMHLLGSGSAGPNGTSQLGATLHGAGSFPVLTWAPTTKSTLYVDNINFTPAASGSGVFVQGAFTGPAVPGGYNVPDAYFTNVSVIGGTIGIDSQDIGFLNLNDVHISGVTGTLVRYRPTNCDNSLLQVGGGSEFYGSGATATGIYTSGGGVLIADSAFFGLQHSILTEIIACSTAESMISNNRIGGVVTGAVPIEYRFTSPTFTIIAVNPAAHTFTVSGIQNISNNPFITVSGSTGNNGNYGTAGTSFLAGNTVISVGSTTIPSAVADGTIQAISALGGATVSGNVISGDAGGIIVTPMVGSTFLHQLISYAFTGNTIASNAAGSSGFKVGGTRWGTISGNIFQGTDPSQNVVSAALGKITENVVVSNTSIVGASGGSTMYTVPYADGGYTVLHAQPGLPFSAFSSTTLADGSMMTCSDCQQTNPCTGGGSGTSFSRRQNGAWQCGAIGVAGGAATQIATFTAPGALTGYSDFTWDETNRRLLAFPNQTITGPVTFVSAINSPDPSTMNGTTNPIQFATILNAGTTNLLDNTNRVLVGSGSSGTATRTSAFASFADDTFTTTDAAAVITGASFHPSAVTTVRGVVLGTETGSLSRTQTVGIFGAKNASIATTGASTASVSVILGGSGGAINGLGGNISNAVVLGGTNGAVNGAVSNAVSINGAVVTTSNTIGLGTQIQLGATTFALLGTPANGMAIYCSDCVQTTPCAGGGSGAFAQRINGAWTCSSGTGSGSGTVTSIATTAPITGGTITGTGTIGVTDFVASGASHARGTVPDPGASAGTTKFLREDATWAVPPGGGASALFANGNCGSAITVNWANGSNQSVTLNSASCAITFSTPVNGSAYTLLLIQDATGNRLVTYVTSLNWSGGTQPTLTKTASKADLMSFKYLGTTYYGIWSLNF